MKTDFRQHRANHFDRLAIVEPLASLPVHYIVDSLMSQVERFTANSALTPRPVDLSLDRT
jgi:hypothetical protein